MIRQCCQCKRVWKEGRWTFARLSQLDMTEITHCYCEDCYSQQGLRSPAKRKRPIRPWHRFWQRLHI